VNNPWLFEAIFIGLLIIKFTIINMQIVKVHKHGDKTFTIKSIPCPMIFSLMKLIHVRRTNNLMFAQVSTHHPFKCATNIFDERKWDLVCHIWILLAPSMHGYFCSNFLSHG
jgi:hypothetical protein